MKASIMLRADDGCIIAREVIVYGGFDMVAKLRLGEGDIEHVTCSCGWTMECNGMSDGEAIEASKQHGLHEDYRKVIELYRDGIVNYDGALGFLVMLDMDESKAEDYLDGMRYGSV